MKYFVFTFYGMGLPIAYKLQQEGHEVVVGQVVSKRDILTQMDKESPRENAEDKKLRLSLFDGLLKKMPADELIGQMKKIPNPQDYFVFFDFNHLFKFSEKVQKLGFHGNFPTEQDRLFEIDRDAAKDFVKKNYPDLNVAEKREFSSIEDAKQFLEKSRDIWVLKGKDEGAKTFIPITEDPDLAKKQVMQTLQHFREDYEKVGFILELRIPSVVELTPEKIYYDGVPLAVTVNMENKPIGSANISVQTGCAADLVFPISMEDRICKIAFPPIADELARNHKGLFFWDASLLIDKQRGDIYFGEFCSNRAGYNSFYTELCQVPSVGNFFESVVARKNPFRLGTVGASTRIFNFHRDDDGTVLGGSAIDYNSKSERDIWLFEGKKQDDMLVANGYDMDLAAITGSGRSLAEAVDNLFNNIDGFSFIGAYWRPKADYISRDYPTSILNRLEYALDKKLFNLPFPLT